MSRRMVLISFLLFSTYLFANPLPWVFIDLRNGEEDYRIAGKPGEEFGYSLATGDVNADMSFEDIVIGAPGGLSGRGIVYLYYGRSTLSTDSPDLLVLGDAALPAGRLGQSVASGDVNADGIDDIVLGCPGSADGGRIYLLYGNASLPDTVDLGQTTPSCRIYAEMSGDRLGADVWTGDLNRDSYVDLIVASPAADPLGREDAGKVYVIYGKADLAGEIDLGAGGADWVIFGAEPFDSIGSSFALGDLNRDGFLDIVLGAPGGDPQGRTGAGKVHVVFGRESFPDIVDLGVDSDVDFAGADPFDRAGTSLDFGDLNIDGTMDLFIGAPGGERSANNSGLIYVFYGKESFPTKIDLGRGEQDLMVFSSVARDRIGTNMLVGRDLLWRDAERAELIVGSPSATPNDGMEDREKAGIIYMVLMFWSSGMVDISDAYNVAVIGGEPLDHIGRSMAIGNVVDLYLEDLVIGAPDVNQGAGEVYVIENFGFTGIGDDSGGGISSPRAAILDQNYPNPFNPSTTIEYALPDAGKPLQVTLELFTVRGERIRTLVDGEEVPGRHTVHWDGKDERGVSVGSGVYIYRLKTGDRVESRKMVLRK